MLKRCKNALLDIFIFRFIVAPRIRTTLSPVPGPTVPFRLAHKTRRTNHNKKSSYSDIAVPSVYMTFWTIR